MERIYLSKHNFKLVKTFEYDDFKKDTTKRDIALDFMSLIVFNKDSIVSFVVEDDCDSLNKWLIEHGALIGETIHIRTYKKD